MDECPVCEESFDLDEHMPKSLDCHHAVCTACILHPRGPPLLICPVCFGDIINPSALPNDPSIIAYLKKNKREKYSKEQSEWEKVKDMTESVQGAIEDVDKHLKEEQASAAKTLEERSARWNSHLKHLFEKCQQRCNGKPFPSDAPTQILRQLEDSQQELQLCLAECNALLDKSRVTNEEIDKCRSKALKAVKKARDIGKSRATQATMWNSYRQLVMEALEEESKVPPSNKGSFVSGD